MFVLKLSGRSHRFFLRDCQGPTLYFNLYYLSRQFSGNSGDIISVGCNIRSIARFLPYLKFLSIPLRPFFEIANCDVKIG